MGAFGRNSRNEWGRIAAVLLVIYGLGEGPGSGCFPINRTDMIPTLDTHLYNFFSGIDDAGLVLFPFMLMRLFPKKENKSYHYYLWLVVGIGMSMIAFFLIAKYNHHAISISYLRGVWQRIYLLNYYLLLLVVSWKMLNTISQND